MNGNISKAWVHWVQKKKKKKNSSVICDLCRPLLVAREPYRCTDTKDDSSAPTKHITVRHVLTKNITTNKKIQTYQTDMMICNNNLI